MPKPKASKERSFIVTVNEKGAVRVENNQFSDAEMIGYLTALTDAYRERFKGGNADGEGTN